jgi:cell wall assembly regulator SMI1
VLADLLRSLAGLRLTDGEGEEHVLRLRPPATAAEIRKLEDALPAPLPGEMRAALGASTGLANGPLESFSLLDLEGFGLEEAFPHVYSIAHDGYGNYWVLDLPPGPDAWGPVFYACHDPPVIAYQAESIEAFLRDVVAMWQPGQRSPVDRMHEEGAPRTGLRVGALRPTHRDPAGRPGTPLGPHSAGAEEGTDAATVRQIFLTGD